MNHIWSMQQIHIRNCYILLIVNNTKMFKFSVTSCGDQHNIRQNTQQFKGREIDGNTGNSTWTFIALKN